MSGVVLLDDHLVRDVVAGERPAALEVAEDEMATTNLWLFRLVGALARQGWGGALVGEVKGLGPAEVGRFRSELVERLEMVTVVPMERLVWSMAELQERHRSAGRHLSSAMVEVLAAAELLSATIAVAEVDVGPHLRAAAEADGVPFRVIVR